MRKTLLIFSLLFMAIFVSAFSFNQWKESTYHEIKKQSVEGFSALFKQKVEVGEAGGVIVGQIVLKEVVIPNFGQASLIYINFNPVAYLAEKDIIPAISKITIVDGDFMVKRNKAGQFSFAPLLSQEKGSDSSPLIFGGKIILKNCKATYIDQLGFRKDPIVFKEEISNLAGNIDFQKKDRLAINVSGKIINTPNSTSLKVSGKTNLKTGEYAINLSADKVDLSKWGNYTIPLDSLVFSEGNADLTLKISPSKIKGWPTSLDLSALIDNASGRFDEYSFKDAFGKILMADDRLSCENLSSQINGIPLVANGKLDNFTDLNLDLSIALKEASLKKIAASFAPSKNLDLEGLGSGTFKLGGTIFTPSVKGEVTVKNGEFYNQSFSGKSSLTFKQGLLKLNINNINLYQGAFHGECELDFSKNIPQLSLETSFTRIDFASLSQNSPGIVGHGKGELLLGGKITDLSGTLKTNLSQASIWGQPIESISSSFQIKEGDIYVKKFSARSKTAKILSSGKIGKDLVFNFQTNAEGINLKGSGILGMMQAMVDSFQGNISWKLNDKFLASPLRNLNASGEAFLSCGRIGEQSFDLAQGKVVMGDGLIHVEDVVVKRNQSLLRASGKTGIGCPSQLQIYGEKINLEDLKILNHLLPIEAQNPTGFTNINIEISGEIPKEARITSFEPLLDLDAAGEFNLTDVNLAEIPINQGRLKILWQNRSLSLSDCFIKMPDSSLVFDLNTSKKDDIKGRASGYLDLYHLKKLTEKYGNLSGNLGLNLNVSGSLKDPLVSTNFRAEDFSYNKIDFDKIEGATTFSQNELTLDKPLRFFAGNDQYEIKGSANLEALYQRQPEEISLDLNLKIVRAGLDSGVNLIKQLQAEFSRLTNRPIREGKAKIDFSSFSLPSPEQFQHQDNILLYGKNSFLEAWDKIFETAKKEESELEEAKLEGELSGNLSLDGKLKNLSGNFNGEIKKGCFKEFSFDSIKTKASLENRKIEIKNLTLRKENGKFTAQGAFGFDGKISFWAAAQNMPLNALRLFFDEEFLGAFNMQSTIEGSLDDLNLSANVDADKVSLAGLDFDQITLKCSTKNNTLFIEDFRLLRGKSPSSISGTIGLSLPREVNLNAELRDNAVGLLNLFTKEVKWIKGKVFAPLKIGGNTEKLVIDGKIFLKDCVLYAKVIDSKIGEIQGEAEIENSRAKIKELSGYWQGATSRNYPNPLALAGNIDLSHFLASKRMVDLDLAFSPSHLQVDLPNQYTGEIKIQAASLNGPLYFDFSKGPILKGAAQIENAVISLNRQRPRPEKSFPLKLDLDIDLEKNTYAIMGDVMTLDLSNIFMNLEIKSEESLKISGSLSAPSILGKILLKRGTVSIFNREFTLLSTYTQKEYFPYDSSKIQENIALFSGEEGAAGIMPDISITAKVEVENIEENKTTGKQEKQKVIILSYLKGIIGATDKEKGLTVAFNSFTKDKNTSPQEIKPANYSEQEIKVMLLPDFIKSLAGVSDGEDTSTDTNAVVADYLSSRLQTVLFRGLERNLEQRLGLESLTLEYNFGKKIRQEMGINDTGVFEEQPDWKVGFVKGFFDKLFVDVRYAETLGQGETAAETSFKYQLTYKLGPIWSIIYYREPPSIEEITSGYQKVTLQAGLSFW